MHHRPPPLVREPDLSLRILFLLLLGLAFSFGMGCSSASGPPPPTTKDIWKVFQKSSSGLVNNHVNAMMLDNSRKIWFATDDGASSFIGGTWATIRDSLTSPDNTRGGLPIHKVNCIVQAKDRSYWFGLQGGGIQRYNPYSSIAVWKRFGDPDLLSEFVSSGAADVSNQTTYGEMWFTSTGGIMRFSAAVNETGTWHQYTQTSTPQMPSNQILSSETKTDDYSIWFGAQTGGAVSASFGLAGNLQWATLPLPYDSKINSIAFDPAPHAVVWFGTQNGAASFTFGSSAWVHFDTATTGPGLRDEPVNAVTTNHQSTRWFGTEGGLVRLRDTTWTRFTAANSPLPSDTVNAVLFDVNQNLWVGTNNGVAVYNEAGITF